MNLIFTNRKFCYKHSSIFETGLINHLQLILSVLKTTLKKKNRNYTDTDVIQRHQKIL